MFDVKSELEPIAERWRAIGEGLRLGFGKLDGIGDQHRCKPQDCLAAVLTKWLKKEYNVEKFGEPTWQWIVKIVASPAAGNDPALAKTIAKKHPVWRGKYIYYVVLIVQNLRQELKFNSLFIDQFNYNSR